MVNGTSVELIKNWISAMEEDIKNNEFYCIKHRDDRYVTPLNKARLFVMYNIFHISSNNYSEGSWKGTTSWKGSEKDHEKEVLAYFETMKKLLGIN
jgi:hypothetical protein